MPPAFERFAHLLTAGPQEMADAVASFEDHLFADKVELGRPMLVLMVLDGTHPERAFKPVVIPYTGEDLVRLGGPAGRGQSGKFAASVASGFHRLPPQAVRGSYPFFADGDRLLYTAYAAEMVHVVQPPSYATDFLLDVPEEHQQHLRVLLACDGRGWLYSMARPDGQAGPPTLEIMTCQADPNRPGRYLHTDVPGQTNVGRNSLVPWALDALASGFRRVFEGDQPQCSDAKPAAKLGKKRHQHRRRRG